MIRFAAGGLASVTLAACGNQPPQEMVSYQAEVEAIQTAFGVENCREEISDYEANNGLPYTERITTCRAEELEIDVSLQEPVEAETGNTISLTISGSFSGDRFDESGLILEQYLDRFEDDQFNIARCYGDGEITHDNGRYHVACFNSDGLGFFQLIIVRQWNTESAGVD